MINQFSWLAVLLLVSSVKVLGIKDSAVVQKNAMVLLERVRTNALDYMTSVVITFHSHAPRKGDGVLSAKCTCFRYYSCPLI